MSPARLALLAAGGYAAGYAGSVAGMTVMLRRKYRGRSVPRETRQARRNV